MLYVRDQLGHSSIKITMDNYGHLVKRTDGQAGVIKLDSDALIRNPYHRVPLRIVNAAEAG
jgi:integrase